MKKMNVVLAAVSALLISAPAFAFHSGGVAECEGCHSMHNSFEGQPNVTGNTTIGQSGPYLLKAQDQSGSCLNCHEGPTLSSYHVSTTGSNLTTGVAPVNLTPGGDFGWLKKTYVFSIRNTPTTDHGERHGHNIVAADFGYAADGTLAAAPGGSYDAAKLACSSCHDPHGRYRRDATGAISTTGLPIFNSGSYTNSADPVAGKGAVGVYRILGGVGYKPASYQSAPAFAAAPPVAVAPSTYNVAEATTQTLVRYGSGMSEWCANCHGAMLSNGYTSGMNNLAHPAGNNAKLNKGYNGLIMDNYNTYVSSGIMTGTAATGYSSLVPFEFGTADYTALKGKTLATMGADASSNVSCLSCHRAHASGFESMLRFFYLNEFMTVADAAGNAMYDDSTTEGKINYGKTPAEQQQAYYGRPASKFGPWARSQCNKCHAKD